MVCSLLPLNVFAADGNILHYDFNGGTFDGKTSIDEYPNTASGEYHYIIDTVPVREGYIFNGWNTQKDGFGDVYKYGDTYYFEEISACYDTIYAQWKLPNWIDYADTTWYDNNPNADEYTISTAEELAGVSKLILDEITRFSGKTITLDNNIELGGKEWTPIGTMIDAINYGFCGNFDGNGYSVSGLNINAKDSYYQALFGYVDNATIKNLKVSGSVTGNNCVAGIVASADHTIIENCVSDCTVVGEIKVGGIVGYNNRGLITDCYNLSNISYSSVNYGASIGGIVGTNSGFVSNCYNIGDVSGNNAVGGIVGNTYFESDYELSFTDPDVLAKCVTNVYNCYNIGSVTGKENVSGVCGFILGSASKCYNLGMLKSDKTQVAGIAFTTDKSVNLVTDCYYLADCNISGNVFANKVGTALSSENFRKEESFSGFDFNTTWQMGPLAPTLKCFDNKGTNDNPYPIANLEMLEYMRDSVNSGDDSFYASFVLLRDIDLGCDNNNQWVPIGTETNDFLASLNGKGHIITGLYINKPNQDYVGFIGQLGVGFTIKNLGVYGTVIGKNYVGGIAGFAYSQFENCFNACNVTGNTYVAGISGQGGFSTFLDCYNMGNITCKEDYCGGITTDPYYTNIYHCYNIGTIDCKGVFVDPIAKESVSENDFESCYYINGCNAEGTVFGVGDGIFALSETDFADESKFTNWNFDTVWDLSDSAVKRPILKNATEKGTSLNPFKVVYTDDKGGAVIHECYYVTANSPTPKCETNTTDMVSWRFVEWDKSIAAKVTGDVTYTAKLVNKAANTVRYHGNGGTCISYGKPSETSDKYWNSDTCTVNSSSVFTRDGYKFIGWNTTPDGTGTTYSVGDTFRFNYPHNGDVYHFYAVWQDTEKPIFTGLENEKTYCYGVKFKVTDNSGNVTVKVGDTLLTADEEGYYTLNYQNDIDLAPVDYTVTATDPDGNTTAVSITLRRFHVMNEWYSDGEYIWKICGHCGEPDDTKYKLPVVTTVANDTVCRSEDYQFTVTLPSNCYFGACMGADFDFIPQLQTDGTYLCVVENHGDYSGRESLDIRIEIWYETDDEDYLFYVDKTVTVIDHKGGTANCKDKAVCTECGKPYGETEPQTHKNELEHFEAKPATVDTTGNIEYWYCSDCDKCFTDKDGKVEITKAETVLDKIALETPKDETDNGDVTPEITYDNAQNVTVGANKELNFKLNTAVSDFIRLEIDGITLEQGDYTVETGSNVITIKSTYVASLLAGEHTLTVVSASGTATANFTVEAANVNSDENQISPKTSDRLNVLFYPTVLFISAIGLVGAVIIKKKKSY